MDSFLPYFPLFAWSFGTAVTLLGFGWMAQSYLNRKFNETHDALNQQLGSLEKNIIQKLEYHERHDDERFSAIDKAVWEIRVRNAARDRDFPNAS